MTGKSGVATAVAAPTIVQRIGNGATLLGGGVAVPMRRCGVADASLTRRAGLSIEDGATGRGAVLWHLCRRSLTGRCDGVAQRRGARRATPRSTSIVSSALRLVRKLAAVETLARKRLEQKRSHCSVIVPATCLAAQINHILVASHLYASRCGLKARTAQPACHTPARHRSDERPRARATPAPGRLHTITKKRNRARVLRIDQILQFLPAPGRVEEALRPLQGGLLL